MSFSLQPDFSMGKISEKSSKANFVNFYIPKVSQENIYNLNNNNAKLIDSDIHKITSPYSTIYLSKLKKIFPISNDKNTIGKLKNKNYKCNPHFENLSVERDKTHIKDSKDSKDFKDFKGSKDFKDLKGSKNLKNFKEIGLDDPHNQSKEHNPNCDMNFTKTRNNQEINNVSHIQQLEEIQNIQYLHNAGKSLDDATINNIHGIQNNNNLESEELQKSDSHQNIHSINPNSKEINGNSENLENLENLANISEKTMNEFLFNNSSNSGNFGYLEKGDNLFSTKPFSTYYGANPYKDYKEMRRDEILNDEKKIKIGDRIQQQELINDYRKTFQTLDNYHNKEKLKSDLKYFRSNKYMVRLGEIKEESLDNQYNKLVYSKFMKVYSKPKIDLYWGNQNTHKNILFLNELININAINQNNLKKLYNNMPQLNPNTQESKINNLKESKQHFYDAKYKFPININININWKFNKQKDAEKLISRNTINKATISTSSKNDLLSPPFPNISNQLSLSNFSGLNTVDYSESKWLNRTNRLIERLKKLKVVKNRTISQALKVDSSKPIQASTNIKDEIRSHINRVLQKYNKMLGLPKTTKL